MRDVGANAFYDCNRLKYVSLNRGLKRLGRKEVVDGLEYEGEVFKYTAIESIRIPSTLKKIEAGTFECCQYLKHIEVPRGVERIGDRCFQETDITEITLPGTLYEIGKDALRYCEKLKTVWVEEGCLLDIREYVDNYVDIKFE